MTARILVRVALVFASVTWMTWGYLHTIGDHTRGEDIAMAVLDDPVARDEVAAPVASQLTFFGDLPPGPNDALRAAVAAALADPDISGQIVGAFAAAHARTLGVDDERTTSIDVAALSLAIHRHLDEHAPELARRIPNDVPLEIDLPVLQIPYADGFRTVAHSSVRWTGLVAAGAAAAAFVLGNRRRVLLRLGLWGFVTGGITVVGVHLWLLGGRSLLPTLDTAVENGIHAATGDVVDAAWILVMAGAAGVALSFLFTNVVGNVAATPDRRTATSDPSDSGTSSGRPADVGDDPSIPGWINGSETGRDPRSFTTAGHGPRVRRPAPQPEPAQRPEPPQDDPRPREPSGPPVWEVGRDGSIERRSASPD